MGYLGRTKPSETTSSVLRSTYTGNGSTTTYALPGPVANETSIIATINGVTQQDAAYSTDGSNIIFVAAPALGDSIEIRTLSAVAMSYAPSAGSVVTGIIADGAVTTNKINDASVTGAKLGTGAAVANIGSRALSVGQMPAGSVIQVVQTVKTDTFSSTAASWVDITGLSASITPSSSSNKIMVIVDMAYSISDINNLNLSWKMVRNSTDIGVGTGGTYNVSGGFNMYLSAGSIPMVLGNSKHYLDSPATTSSTTYKVQIQKADASGTLYVNRRGNSDTEYRSISVITLMEIAG
jgi:hypothetical protein